jgi:hypothetical protein
MTPEVQQLRATLDGLRADIIREQIDGQTGR